MTSTPRRIVKRFPFFLAFIGLALLAGGVVTWLLLPPSEITASILLHVNPVPPRIHFEEDEDAAPPNEAYMRTQSFLIHNRFVLTTALRNPEVARLPLVKEKDDPIQWLETSIVVDFPSPEFMRIILSGERPEEQKIIVKAVVNAYLDSVVNKERNERLEKRKKLEALQMKLEQDLRAKKKLLRDLQEKAEGFNEEGIVFGQQFAQEELQALKKQIVEVRQQLLALRVELELHPDWQEQLWPAYAAMLNCQLGPGLPVNQAFVVLLHRDAHLLSQAAEGDRRQKQEKLRFLAQMEKALLVRAEQLDRQTNRRSFGVDLDELQEEFDRLKKLAHRVSDKIIKLDVERESPPRITLPSSEAFLSAPDATKRKIMVTSAAALTGLGILLLALAAFQFRAAKPHDLEEPPPTPQPPE